jgi:serine acetyltransferase
MKIFFYSLAKKILRFSIPVNWLTKPLFKVIYILHISVREFLSWLIRFFYFEPLFRSQCVKVGKSLWMEKLPYIVNNGKIIIGDFVRLSGKLTINFSTKVFTGPALTIGNNTFIGHNVTFSVAREIAIGNYCYIAGGVNIADNDGHPLEYQKRRDNFPPEKDSVKPVKIGNDVWVGRSAFILKGVTIGDRSVVGAGSIVIEDMPADCVVAGNPARVVKRLA